jgi:hypothetical protein
MFYGIFSSSQRTPESHQKDKFGQSSPTPCGNNGFWMVLY